VLEVAKVNDAEVEIVNIEEVTQESWAQKSTKQWERKDSPWMKMATQSRHREGESRCRSRWSQNCQG
jgi:hypothetical protein